MTGRYGRMSGVDSPMTLVSVTSGHSSRLSNSGLTGHLSVSSVCASVAASHTGTVSLTLILAMKVSMA